MVEYNDNDEEIDNDYDDDDDDDDRDGDDDDHDAGAGADDNDLMSERRRLIKESKGSRSCSNKLEGFSLSIFRRKCTPQK